MKKLICIIPALEKNNYSRYGDLIEWGGTTLIEWKISQILKIKKLRKLLLQPQVEKLNQLFPL